LLVFRDNRPVESCTRVGEVKYLKPFLAHGSDCISYLTFSYYTK